jgi:hypothetical protein
MRADDKVQTCPGGYIVKNRAEDDACLTLINSHIEEAERRIRTQKGQLVRMLRQENNMAHKARLLVCLFDAIGIMRRRREKIPAISAGHNKSILCSLLRRQTAPHF